MRLNDTNADKLASPKYTIDREIYNPIRSSIGLPYRLLIMTSIAAVAFVLLIFRESSPSMIFTTAVTHILVGNASTLREK